MPMGVIDIKQRFFYLVTAISREVIEKVIRIHNRLSAKGLMTEDLSSSLRQCKSLTDITMLVSIVFSSYCMELFISHSSFLTQTEPFKDSAPKSLASKARTAGIEPVATAVFRFNRQVDFSTALIDMPASEVETGVLNIIAEWICKDFGILRAAEEL